MAVLAVILHDMPQDRLMADWHHWFWNVLRVIPDMQVPSPPPEQRDFHDTSSRGSINSTLGIGTMNLQPHAATWPHLCNNFVPQLPGQNE